MLIFTNSCTELSRPRAVERAILACRMNQPCDDAATNGSGSLRNVGGTSEPHTMLNAIKQLTKPYRDHVRRRVRHGVWIPPRSEVACSTHVPVQMGLARLFTVRAVLELGS